MSDWYAPNQQAVRADGSGPAEEGSGGRAPKKSEAAKKKAAAEPVAQPVAEDAPVAEGG